MKFRPPQLVIALCLLLAAAFAGWMWFRPYEWRPDPAARAAVMETQLSRDQSFYWLHVHLKVNPGKAHDLEKPVWLETAAQEKHEPADSTFGAIAGTEPRELWFKFWLEPKDLAGPLKLHLNGGSLAVKAGSAVPVLEPSTSRNFTTSRW